MLAAGVAALPVVWIADDGGGEAKKAGPIALVVILLLAVACYFLFRSMTRHLRKVRDEFPVDGPAAPSEPGQPPSDQDVPSVPDNGTEPTPPS